MLLTVQYIALVQGLFLITVLLKNKARYRKPVFWLFLGSLISVVLFVLGDDENNVFFEDIDMFLFDSSLFITFLFLFFKYKRSGQTRFILKDLIYFLPNILYVGIETAELLWDSDFLLLEALEFLTEFTFLIYLLSILIAAIRFRTADRLLVFVVPLVLISGLNYVANIREMVTGEELVLFGYEDYNSYLLLVLAFLFFFISFGLIDKPGQIIPRIKNGGYRQSRLRPEQILEYERKLIDIMENEKIFMNQKLSIHEVSDRIDVPRRYISEVLNSHMKVSFQEFVNRYRIAAFIERLHQPKYKNYTLFGLASEMGFNSKSTFNSAFKKATELTPLDYKNSIQPIVKTGPE
ncbi:MAG: helix-turn-helix domain-containing protein [Flavobacteriaceae bacterium]